MTDAERETWIFGAVEQIEGENIPAKPFFDSVFKARSICDHPMKAMKAITQSNMEWSANLRRTEKMKRALYENANAPRLERKEIEMPDDEREAAAKEIRDAVNHLTSIE